MTTKQNRPGAMTRRGAEEVSRMLANRHATPTGGSTVFLTLAEAAGLARCKPKTLRNLMSRGVLCEGVHFTRPVGRRPLFKRDAVLAWLNDAGADPRLGRGGR